MCRICSDKYGDRRSISMETVCAGYVVISMEIVCAGYVVISMETVCDKYGDRMCRICSDKY